MKKRIRGLKRAVMQLDFDLYRVKVPIPAQPGSHLSVIDLHPQGVQTTILFQHGFAGVAESWEYQLTHFASQYRVIAPELRGHGQSDAPHSDYSMSELVADMHTVVNALGVSRRFVLAGHSFGGCVCIEYALAHPERIAKLVLVATAGEFPLPRAASALFRIPIAVALPFWRYRRRWDAEYHALKSMYHNAMSGWEAWHLLPRIDCETLVITGERDNFFPRYVYDDVARLIPGAEVRDVGYSKHKVQLERHEAVNRELKRFIATSPRRSWWALTTMDLRSRGRPWLAHYDKDIPHSIPIPQQPLFRFLESVADWLPKRTATVFYGKTLSYRELEARTNRFARGLRELGVARGDRVQIVLPNTPQFIIAYYAALKLGAVVVLSNPEANAEQILSHARETEAKALVTLSAFSQLAQLLQSESAIKTLVFTRIGKHVTTGSPSAFGRHRQPSSADEELASEIGAFMSAVMDDQDSAPLGIDVAPSDLAVISYTSGTTGSPRGVCLSHRNLVANALQTRHWLPEIKYGEEVVLAVVPFEHSYGMTAAMNLPIFIAAKIVILSVFELRQVLEQIRRYKPTIFPGVPAMFTALNQAKNVRSYGLSSIKACISGAAPLPIEVQEAFEKLTRGRLVEGYGLTEASPVTHSNPLKGQRKVGSIGIPLPNTDARIVAQASGAGLPSGEIGELTVRGPQVMQGYWRANDEDEAAVLRDGWLYTGDVAVMDDEGYFKIISRKRDTIFTGDYSVYPRDVEEVLYEHSKVLEAAVIGVGCGSDGQRVKAFVVPRPDASLSKHELLDLCKRRLVAHAVPGEIEFRQALPRSFIGKVLRRVLHEEEVNRPKES
ncbi:MAG: alpha/beta fold hydrolase [Chloroflexi bacterium]|nr:alpha/beta fold hydrolase [Chloroflexota bacterium]